LCTNAAVSSTGTRVAGNDHGRSEMNRFNSVPAVEKLPSFSRHVRPAVSREGCPTAHLPSSLVAASHYKAARCIRSTFDPKVVADSHPDLEIWCAPGPSAPVFSAPRWACSLEYRQSPSASRCLGSWLSQSVKAPRSSRISGSLLYGRP
jgi:hypothetical protein